MSPASLFSLAVFGAAAISVPSLVAALHDEMGVEEVVVRYLLALVVSRVVLGAFNMLLTAYARDAHARAVAALEAAAEAADEEAEEELRKQRRAADRVGESFEATT